MDKVLVIGSGGREHTLVWKLKQSAYVARIYCAPGNAGTAKLAENIDIRNDDLENLIGFAEKEKIDLTIAGPEVPLVKGIVDVFEDRGLAIFGPCKEAARIEGSKVFAKKFMRKYCIPTADFEVFDNAEKAKDFIKNADIPIVVKADGLAAGKGVILCSTLEDAFKAVNDIMVKRVFSSAGDKIIVEEFLKGEEASVLALTDGFTIKTLASSQDHKAIFDNDKGPNTGGMGAYAPAPVISGTLSKEIYDKILFPTINGMGQEGLVYKGCLYAGLMIVDNKPKVLEFNCRFGDPETQPVLTLLDSDLYPLLFSCINGGLHNTEINNKKGAACCVIMASGGYPGEYKKGEVIFGLDDVPKNVCVFHSGTAEREGKIVTDGGRILGVTAYGSGIEEAINLAYEGVSRIRFKGEHHRTDIGKRILDRI